MEPVETVETVEAVESMYPKVVPVVKVAPVETASPALSQLQTLRLSVVLMDQTEVKVPERKYNYSIAYGHPILNGVGGRFFCQKIRG